MYDDSIISQNPSNQRGTITPHHSKLPNLNWAVAPRIQNVNKESCVTRDCAAGHGSAKRRMKKSIGSMAECINENYLR